MMQTGKRPIWGPSEAARDHIKDRYEIWALEKEEIPFSFTILKENEVCLQYKGTRRIIQPDGVMKKIVYQIQKTPNGKADVMHFNWLSLCKCDNNDIKKVRRIKITEDEYSFEAYGRARLGVTSKEEWQFQGNILLRNIFEDTYVNIAVCSYIPRRRI